MCKCGEGVGSSSSRLLHARVCSDHIYGSVQGEGAREVDGRGKAATADLIMHHPVGVKTAVSLHLQQNWQNHHIQPEAGGECVCVCVSV